MRRLSASGDDHRLDALNLTSQEMAWLRQQGPHALQEWENRVRGTQLLMLSQGIVTGLIVAVVLRLFV